MRLKTLILVPLLAAGALATSASAQPAPAPATQTFINAAGVAAAIDRASKAPKAPLVGQRLIELAPYRGNLEYRTAVGPAAM